VKVTLTQVGESGVKVYPVDVNEFMIGRDFTCHLRIDHGRISRNHCRVLVESDRVLVEALYSKAGTALNQKILDPRRPPVEVRDGDTLWVGHEPFRFSIGAGAAPAPPERSAPPDPASNPLLRDVKDVQAQAAQQVMERLKVPGLGGLGGRPPDPPSVAADDDTQLDVPVPTPAPVPTPLGTFVVTRVDGVAVVRLLKKAIISDADIRAITEELGDLIDSGQNCITLHLGEVERLSSEVLGEVFQVYRRCKTEGGMLKICRVSPQVAGIFALTNMQKHIEIFPDEAQALKSAWPRRAAEPPRPEARKVRLPAPAPAPAPPATPVTPATPSVRVRLVVEVGRAKGRTIEIDVPRFLIGRGEQCHLRPNSGEISRLHTAIEQRGGRVFVRDLGSQTGTVLNGRVLRDEEAPAAHGDRLQIEALQFTFAIETSAGPPPRADGIDSLAALFGGPPPDPNSDTMLMSVLGPDTAALGPAGGTPREKPRRQRYITRDQAGGVSVITFLTPDLTVEDGISAVRAELESVRPPDGAGRDLRVFRFDRVEALSLGAVVMLLARAQALARAGGAVRYCHVSPKVMAFLETTRLPMLIDIYPTLDAALADPWDAAPRGGGAAPAGPH